MESGGDASAAAAPVDSFALVKRLTSAEELPMPAPVETRAGLRLQLHGRMAQKQKEPANCPHHVRVTANQLGAHTAKTTCASQQQLKLHLAEGMCFPAEQALQLRQQDKMRLQPEHHAQAPGMQHPDRRATSETSAWRRGVRHHCRPLHHRQVPRG